MAKGSQIKLTCALLCSSDPYKIRSLVETISEAIKELQGELILIPTRNKKYSNFLQEKELEDISKSDLILVEDSIIDSDVLYGLGVAHGLGKPVISIVPESPAVVETAELRNNIVFTYELTPKRLAALKNDLKEFISSFLKNPMGFLRFFPYSKKLLESSLIIDLEKLEPREYENLCFELISQMGFKKVSWGVEIPEFDVLATLPKKDPDGFEYDELWLLNIGNKASSEKVLDLLLKDPDFLFFRIQKLVLSKDIFAKNWNLSSDTSITLLFILKEQKYQEIFEKRIERVGMSFQKRGLQGNVRIRTWDQNYLRNLIQSYPQIAYKYFSEESITNSKYRKSSEELYNENVVLTEQLLRSKAIIEEEKKKRFIAERDNAWKDVAFKAAHKLGNPVDATDTFLQSLKRKLNVNDIDNAKSIAELMDNTIEEAKSVIGQFKSLTKLEEINSESCDIVKIIQNSCKAAEEHGVSVTVTADENLPFAFVDPIRIAECINELVANSLHWFNKQDKIIRVLIKKASNSEIPETLNSTESYLKVVYEDNGWGIPIENKEKIFSPFFSTYQHGTGLGLSIARKVIELQGGWVKENGKPGEGASFEIYLPVKQSNK